MRLIQISSLKKEEFLQALFHKFLCSSFIRSGDLCHLKKIRFSIKIPAFAGGQVVENF